MLDPSGYRHLVFVLVMFIVSVPVLVSDGLVGMFMLVLSIMQGGVNGFRQGFADSLNFSHFINTRLTNFLNAAKIPDQLPAALRAHTLNTFQRRLPALLISTRPMPSDGKTVRLVADVLNQMIEDAE